MSDTTDNDRLEELLDEWKDDVDEMKLQGSFDEGRQQGKLECISDLRDVLEGHA